MGAFLVSIIAGIFFPIVPIIAEYGYTNHVKPDTWTITAVVYAVAIGLVSRNQVIVISSFFFSIVCAVIYGADVMGLRDTHPDIFFAKYGATITIGTFFFYSLCYLIERFGRHVIDEEPFLEL